MRTPTLIAACALFAGAALASSAMAQTMHHETLQNVAQLSASGSVEVQQDLLSISLSTTRDVAPRLRTVRNVRVGPPARIRPGCSSLSADQPPATAGMMLIWVPSGVGLRRPSRNRTSSLPT